MRASDCRFTEWTQTGSSSSTWPTHDPHLPIEDESVDYAQSLGVIHHTSDPAAVLREIHRVLKPGGTGCVMVYNRDSVWLHLYTAYERMIREGAFRGLDVEEAFARNTDGADVPDLPLLSRRGLRGVCARAAGFERRYAGGYLSRRELRSLDESWAGRDSPTDGWRRASGLPARADLRRLRASHVPRLSRGYRRGLSPAQRSRRAIVTEPDGP